MAVLGAGPAGSATALRLRSQGVERVLLTEASHFEVDRIGESVPPDTRRLLDDLDVLSAFLEEDHEPCLGSCSSWGNDGVGYNDFAVNVFGSGWHLDRTRFDAFLADQAAERGAALACGYRYRRAQPHPSGGYSIRLKKANGEEVGVTASLVVDATGHSARFARARGARRRITDRLICVAGTFHLPGGTSLRRLTMLESCTYGWWYAARLGPEKAVVVVATDSRRCRERNLTDRRSWFWQLARTNHIGAAVDGGTLSGSLKASPALSSRLDRMSGPDWVAVGDAAMTYDPLTSQGIYKALATGALAGDAIAAALSGDREALSDYETRLSADYRDYERLRTHLYETETRWREHPFWRARTSASTPADAAGATNPLSGPPAPRPVPKLSPSGRPEVPTAFSASCRAFSADPEGFGLALSRKGR